MPTIDAHQHFWHTDAQDQPWRSSAHGALQSDFLPADLSPELARAGVHATVLMQSVDEQAENDRLARFAVEANVAGVVGWIPIRDEHAALAELDRISMDKLCGVRCLIADDPLDWLLEPRTLQMFRDIAARGLAWDVVPITASQTDQVIKLARAAPELRIVIDHLGRPPLDSRGWEPWADHVTQLARNPAVVMKVSVGIDALTTWSRWDATALKPYVDHAIDMFGPERLMLGSNWPVVLLRASYTTAWNDVKRLLSAALPDPRDQTAVLGGTASSVYGLGDHGNTGAHP